MKRKKGMDRNSKRCKNIGETQEKFHLKIESRKLLFSILTRSRIRDWRTILLKRRCTFFSPLPSPPLFFFFSVAEKGKGRFASTHSLQSRVIRVPRDHRNPQVAGQLQKVLGAGRAAPVLLVVHQVQDGRHVFREEVVAQRFQDL